MRLGGLQQRKDPGQAGIATSLRAGGRESQGAAACLCEHKIHVERASEMLHYAAHPLFWLRTGHHDVAAMVKQGLDVTCPERRGRVEKNIKFLPEICRSILPIVQQVVRAKSLDELEISFPANLRDVAA